MSSLINVIRRIGSHVPEPFIAPVVSARRVSLMSLQDNIPYWFDLKDPVPGWWRVVPSTKSQAHFERNAYPFEYVPYLSALPKFYCTYLYRLDPNSVLAVPFNASDAAQRGWFNSEPRVIHLCKAELDTFELISVRSVAGTLLYDTVWAGEPLTTMRLRDYLQNGYIPHNELENRSNIPRNYRVAYELVLKRQLELEELRMQLERKQVIVTAESRIRDRLGMVGADLVEWAERDGGYSVTYEYNGADFTVDVARDLRLTAAPICLAGTDRNHDLGSIVHVLEEGRRRRRFDMDEEKWL